MNTNYSHLRDKHSWITPKDFSDLLEHSYQRHREDGAQTLHRQMGIDSAYGSVSASTSYETGSAKSGSSCV